MSNQEVDRRGRTVVSSALRWLGVSNVSELVEGRITYVLAGRPTNPIRIRVRTCRTGTWQPSADDGQLVPENYDEDRFWVFVDAAKGFNEPQFYIAPDWWVRTDIYNAHRGYLFLYEGKRAVAQESKHHALPRWRLTYWKSRWAVLPPVARTGIAPKKRIKLPPSLFT